jgi:integrase/recombinase XerD
MLRYLDDCALDEQSPQTIEGKKYEIRGFVRWHIIHQGSYLEDVCKASVDDYKRFLLTYRNSHTNAPIEKNTRRNKLKAVRIFCQSMVELGLIDENPALRVRVPRAPIKLVQAILQRDEIDAILAQTALHGEEGQRDWTILSVFFACGLRAGEVTRLTISSVNFEVGMLFISQSKGEKDRIVPIDKNTIRAISSYLKYIRPKLMRLYTGNTLFLNNKGEPYTRPQMTAMVSKYKRRAGVDKPGACNLYRHTTATTMLDNGAELIVVQKMLGHKSIVTTQGYTHVAVKKLGEEYDQYHPAARGNLRQSDDSESRISP